LGANHLIRILIAEDEPDLRELLGIFIGFSFEAQIEQARNGTEAIEFLKTHSGDFDLVISDYHMPEGNGSVVEAYLRDNYPHVPFMLITGGTSHDLRSLMNFPLRTCLEKPYDEETLQAAIRQLLEKSSKPSQVDPNYVPILLSTLVKIRELKAPLFLRLGPDHFVKVISEGSTFTDAQRDHFLKKGVLHLHVSRPQYRSLVEKFRQRVRSDMVMTNLKSEKREAIQLSKDIQEVVHSTIRAFHIDQDVIELVNENISMIHKVATQTSGLKNVMGWFLEDQSDHLMKSIILSYFTSILVTEVSPANPRAQEILAMASFFHDLSLSNDIIYNKLRYLNAIQLKSAINKTQIQEIKSHPQKVSQLLQAWKDCPPDLISVIERHHEWPDGSGFPASLKAADIDELTAIFIVAQQLSEIYVDTRNIQETRKQMMALAPKLLQPPTQKAFEVTLEQLTESAARKE
jgi:response regulator RpfG family c-di-GMP phosphodiesterase